MIALSTRAATSTTSSLRSRMTTIRRVGERGMNLAAGSCKSDRDCPRDFERPQRFCCWNDGDQSLDNESEGRWRKRCIADAAIARRDRRAPIEQDQMWRNRRVIEGGRIAYGDARRIDGQNGLYSKRI